MKGIFSPSNSAAYNLATEEYLLRHSSEDAFFLYVNSPSIIVGKHQNTLAEINHHFIQESGIPVYRRLSGGGTVYHDYGNLNFCFIQSGEKGELVNFEKYTRPIQNALIKLGIDVEFGKRHDLLIQGKKISGNASHVFKNRVMHHGTLLFNSDLNVLNNALKTNPIAFKDKAVKSVRSEVTNISNYLSEKSSFEDFSNYLFTYLLENSPQSERYQLSEMENLQIDNLVKEKYSTWIWNYGYSPKFEFKKRILTKNKIRLSCRLIIEKGFIREIEMQSSNPELTNLINKIKSNMIGKPHEKNAITDILLSIPKTALQNVLVDDLIELFI